MWLVLNVLMSVLVATWGECPSVCSCKRLPRADYSYYLAVKCDRGLSASERLSNLTRELVVSGLDDPEELLGAIAELRELRGLVLTHSAISSNASITFEGLRSLSLSGNNLTRVPLLGGNLTELKLSFNSITHLNQAFPSLKILDLSHNNLTTLTLKGLDNLQHLNLSHNNLRLLPPASFSCLGNLQQLDVSWNKLTSVALQQLPSLSRLLLAGNSQLRDPHELLLGVGQRVQIVDVSRTGLKQVPLAITHSIKTLKLLDNAIKSVSCGELDAYPLLQHLDLSSNRLIALEDDALGRLEFLSQVRFTDNLMQGIPRSLPETLRELFLGSNSIASISKSDLSNLPLLEVLILNHNKILTIEPDSFTSLKSLVTLDLSRNSIKSLSPGIFPEPVSLQILRLSGIDLVSPASDVSFPFSSTDNLVSLDLSNSPGLARQFIADTAALASSRELQELDISGADLEHIRSDLFHFLSQLRVIRLRDNRLNCTGLAWLAVWMRRQVQPELRYVTCASPPEYWGMALVDLEFETRNQGGLSGERNETRAGVKGLGSANETLRVQNLTVLNGGAGVEVARDNDSRAADSSMKNSLVQQRQQQQQNGTTTAEKFVIKRPPTVLPPPSRHASIFDDTFGKTGTDNNNGGMQILREVNLTDDGSQWNASTVRTSMYKTNPYYDSPPPPLLHPGMLIVGAGLLAGTVVTLLVLLIRFNRNRGRGRDPEVIPVTSIASVSDLW